MSKKKDKYGLNWIFKKAKGTRFLLMLYALFVIINTGLTLSMAYFLKIFVDIATGNSDSSLVNTALLALAAMGLVGVITMINAVLTQFITGKTERNLRMEVMDIILSRRLVDISKHHTGELQTKLTADIQTVSECFVTIIRSMVGGLTSALLATAAMFLLNWKMALVMLVLTPVLLVVMGIFTPFMKKASEADKRNDEVNRSIMQENLSRIMLIKAYFMRGKTTAKIKKTYADKLKSGIRLGMWTGLVSFSANLVANAMFMVALGLGAYFILKGETTVGSLIAIVQLLNYIVNPVANFAGALTQVSQATASSGRIGALYELPADVKTAAVPPVAALELTASGVSFSYGEAGTDDILKHVNASFQKGIITGIVGKSGSGKSTLLKLLIGLYSPKDGKVELKHQSGVLSGEEILPQIAYVPPVDYLFSGTVAENIAMTENEPNIDEMKKAAADANIIDFIESLPQGFDTMIGESGGTVSSGQAQRIAIARAIYKKSPVIVFDEPTANLDVESIEKFQSAVKLLSKDKICIMVTHDVSTITVCDKVYVLEDGGVREKREDEELVMEEVQ